MLISNCCGYPFTEDNHYHLCPKCLEHCEFIDDEDDPEEDDGSLDMPKENEL